MTSSGRTTQPAKGTNRCTRSMNGHILHRFAAGRSPFQLTSANHRHASSGWGEAPLAGDRQDLEVSPADGAFEGADDGAVVVVRPEHVQRLAILAERDGARPCPRTQVPGGSGEVRVRFEAQASRVPY